MNLHGLKPSSTAKCKCNVPGSYPSAASGGFPVGPEWYFPGSTTSAAIDLPEYFHCTIGGEGGRMPKTYEDVMAEFRATREAERELWKKINDEILVVLSAAPKEGRDIDDITEEICKKLKTSSTQVVRVIWSMFDEGVIDIGSDNIFLMSQSPSTR
jgi:hypothetical protein